jgi:hypothetical protein
MSGAGCNVTGSDRATARRCAWFVNTMPSNHLYYLRKRGYHPVESVGADYNRKKNVRLLCTPSVSGESFVPYRHGVGCNPLLNRHTSIIVAMGMGFVYSYGVPVCCCVICCIGFCRLMEEAVRFGNGGLQKPTHVER